MSYKVMVIGESGSGKSRSLINLDPKETFIINVIGKPLPFRGWAAKYKQVKGNTGNLFVTDDAEKVKQTIVYVDEKRPDIKTLVIDDWQYIMADEFMRRGKEKGYEKFTEIGMKAWETIWQANICRSDLCIVFLTHCDTNDSGKIKAKTIGKMLDEKVCIEGMFSVVLQSVYSDGKYYFETQTNGFNTVKSPEGMFAERRIKNDLKAVIEAIKTYEKGE